MLPDIQLQHGDGDRQCDAAVDGPTTAGNYTSNVNVTTTVLLSALIVSLLLPLTALAQAPREQVTQVDAVSVSPDRFKTLFENQHVRVVEYTLLPGERDEWHTHPPKVSYVVTGGTLRITTDDGQAFVADEKTGSASWMDALGRHFAQNVGTSPVRIILVEIKGAW